MPLIFWNYSQIRLHRCWWRLLETKCLVDNFKMLVTFLTISVTNTQKMSPTLLNCHQLHNVNNMTVAGCVWNGTNCIFETFGKIPQFQNANVMQLLLHEYTRTRMFKILHFGTKLHSIIYFEIFPILIFIFLNLTSFEIHGHLRLMSHQWLIIDES